MKKAILFVFVFFLISVLSFGASTVKIGGWPGNPTEEAAMKLVVDTFNQKDPEIQAVWEPIPGDYRQMLTTQLSAGTAPDLFYVDVYWFEEIAMKNLIQPLDLYINNEGFDIESFYQPIVDAFKYKGRTYGFGKDFSTLALFYNKEIFDKYGVAYPTNDDTWEDFLNKALALKERGLETPLVIAPDFNRLIPVILSFGGRIVDEDLNTALNDPLSVEGLKYYVELVTKHKVAKEPSSVGASWIGEAFGKENVAMAMSGPWTLGYVRESFPNVAPKMGIVELPHKTEKSTMLYTVCLAINRASGVKDAAWEFVKYFSSEGQKLWVENSGVLAGRKSIAALDIDPMKKAFYDGAVFAYPWKVETPSGVFSQAETQLNSLLKDLFYEKITVEDAVQFIVSNYPTWVQKR